MSRPANTMPPLPAMIPTAKYPLLRWLSQSWFGAKRRAVLEGYETIGRDHPLVVADVALRGNVFSGAPRIPGDVFADGINEGRRLLALEIIEMCGSNHLEILKTLERKPERTP